ncbi:MAG TPA: thymidylate synthase, partial [Gammaproteobacteria bacterium]|nr:thymidylate synthase [Gammaproteobacteria bacterium]
GETFFGAYGPKVRDQLPHVISTLCQDPDSRQAVINIWRESPPRSRDIPCTLSAQWLVRTDEAGRRFVYCVDTMRSSDAWLGWPYDVFNFTMLSAYVAASLARAWGEPVYLGELVLQAGSQHLYRRDLEGAKACLQERRAFSYRPLNPMDFADDPELVWAHLKALADRDLSALILSPSTFLVELVDDP